MGRRGTRPIPFSRYASNKMFWFRVTEADWPRNTGKTEMDKLKGIKGNRELIADWQARPCLWDDANIDYSKTEVKAKQIEELANKFATTSKAIITRLQSYRTMYWRNRKKERSGADYYYKSRFVRSRQHYLSRHKQFMSKKLSLLRLHMRSCDYYYKSRFDRSQQHYLSRHKQFMSKKLSFQRLHMRSCDQLPNSCSRNLN